MTAVVSDEEIEVALIAWRDCNSVDIEKMRVALNAAAAYRRVVDAAVTAWVEARFPILDEWHPIKTAPRDGARILVDFGGRVGVHAVSWTEAASGIEIWCVDDMKHGPYAVRGYIETDVRGWMPLPEGLEL